MAKILLIGQAPNRTGDPTQTLQGKLGEKIADLCGVTRDEYLEIFERVNVLDRWPGKSGKGDAFPMALARRRAKQIKLRGDVVFLGKRTAAAFGVSTDFLRWLSFSKSTRVAVLPHPSGVNPWYNNPANRRYASAFMRRLIASRRPASR